MTELPNGYLFAGFDSFSGVNAALAAELRGRFSPELAQLDLRDGRRLGRGVVLNAPVGNLRHALVEHRRPRRAVRLRLFTRFMFEHRSAVVRASVRSLHPDFSVQTQTIFDASVPGVPAFIYTDHTALANQRYAWPPAAQEARTSYLDLERTAYRAAAAIYVSSQFAADSLTRQYGVRAERVLVVGSGVNLAIPAEVPVRRRPIKRFLFIGLEWERKGGPELISAFRQLRATNPSVELAIAGAIPTVDEPGVTVLGRVDPTSVPRLLLDADAFVMPSWLEPSAGVYLEASAYGLPILATRVGGTPGRVIDGVTGLLSEPGDVARLVHNAQRLIDTPERAWAMGAAGYQLIAGAFTWPHVGKAIAQDIAQRLKLG